MLELGIWSFSFRTSIESVIHHLFEFFQPLLQLRVLRVSAFQLAVQILHLLVQPLNGRQRHAAGVGGGFSFQLSAFRISAFQFDGHGTKASVHVVEPMADER